MKRVFASTCLAMLCAAGLAAQTQTDDQRRKPEPAQAQEKAVTLVGCLRAGEMPNSFVLANAKPDVPGEPPAASAVPPTTSTPPTPPTEPPTNPPTPPTTPPDPATPPSRPEIGTSGAMAGGASEDVKLLGAPASLDLSKHVGHTVAITGAWAPAGKATRPTGTTGTATPTASEARSFNVKSLTMRSETCK